MQTEVPHLGWLLLLPLGFRSYMGVSSSGGSCPTFVGHTGALMGGVCSIYTLLFSAALTLAAAGGAEPAVSCEHSSEQPAHKQRHLTAC